MLLARYIKCITQGSSLRITPPQAGHFLMEATPMEISEIIETFIRKKMAYQWNQIIASL